jgi:ATP-binding cassette subfamily F protein uup
VRGSGPRLSFRVAVQLSVRDLSHAFGGRPLFSGVTFTLSDGDRVGLIGPNGTGKSTLLKILAGELAADRGEVARRTGLRIAYLAQVPEFSDATVRAAVQAGLGRRQHDGFEDEGRVDEWLNRLELDPDAAIAKLSGGWQKRVALARALVTDPELLLLDEPTNHLDLESILWLERFLAGARFATLTVTHDRLFLQRISNRILELDRRNAGGLIDVAGDYAAYVEHKAQAMASQEQREQALRNTLRRETEWLRRSPSARSTKQNARIERAGAIADEVAELTTRNRTGSVGLDFQARDPNESRPKRLIEARNISKSFGDQLVFGGVSLFIGPKTRLGLLGPNGSGKSTLLRALTGEDPPTTGEVLRADNLKVATFEQNRGSLDPSRTLADTVSPDGDFVQFRGAHVHRNGYLERFLFKPDQMRQPVGSLSGGEQSRLLLARLMLSPANVLVLDEPTNDLDLPTLTVLEEALSSFEGAVLLVTHDRYFLDQVATDLIAFHTAPAERGKITAFADLSQWEAWHAERQASARAAPTTKSQAKSEPAPAPKPRKKLSYSEQRDYDTIEGRILEAESRLQTLEAELAHPDVVSNASRLIELSTRIAELRLEIDRMYTRWAELEALVKPPS